MIKVSILVPIYGIEKYIERCADSLLSQTYENIEYIFVNDCTKDNSLRILENTIKRYPHRKSQIKIINHSSNKGLASTRNSGLETLTGDYILLVDGDDYIEKETVSFLVGKLTEFRGINLYPDIILFDTFHEFNEKSVITQNPYPLIINKELYLTQILLRDIFPTVWGKMYSAKLFKENNIRFIDGLNFGEDFVTLPRLVYNANLIANSQQVLYHYNRLNEGAYTNNWTKRNIDDLYNALIILKEFFLKKDNVRFSKILDASIVRNFLYLYRNTTGTVRQYAEEKFHPLLSEVDGIPTMLNKKFKLFYCIYRLPYILRGLLLNLNNQNN